jgi:hypothetical protein
MPGAELSAPNKSQYLQKFHVGGAAASCPNARAIYLDRCQRSTAMLSLFAWAYLGPIPCGIAACRPHGIRSLGV